MRHALIISSIVFVCALTGHAEDAAPESYFVGVRAYQAGQWEQAKSHWQKTLQENPDNALTLYNLGLAEQRLNRRGWALALWRRALEQNPSFAPAQEALAFTLRGIPSRASASGYENFLDFAVRPIALGWFLFLLTLAAALAAWLWLAAWGQRRREEDAAMPGEFSWLFLLSASTVALAAVALTLLKVWDFRVIRGTVVEAKVPVLSQPADTGSLLIELEEGSEVLLRQAHQDWLQISYPGGPVGWVPKKSVFFSKNF